MNEIKSLRLTLKEELVKLTREIRISNKLKLVELDMKVNSGKIRLPDESKYKGLLDILYKEIADDESYNTRWKSY